MKQLNRYGELDIFMLSQLKRSTLSFQLLSTDRQGLTPSYPMVTQFPIRYGRINMIRFLLPLIMLFSPILLIFWRAFTRVGLTWSLLLIPVGAFVGFVLMALAGACFYEFMIKLEDQRTGPPESGAIGAATGRAIMTFIWMILSGWIGSGVAAWLVTSYWVK